MPMPFEKDFTMQYIEVHSTVSPPKQDEQAGPQICLSAFPELFAKHWDSDESTRSVEIYGQEFVSHKMPRDRLLGFMRMVFGWGGSRNIGNNFMRSNAGKLDCIRHQFLKSLQHLEAGQDKEAIKSLTALTGLGVSYASKHLKFLSPDKAVVLDSLIERGLGYKQSANGYVEFVNQCRQWAKLLNNNKIHCKRTTEGEWRVSDVEMAVFIHVRETAPKPKDN
jgi:hypothetical protein